MRTKAGSFARAALFAIVVLALAIIPSTVSAQTAPPTTTTTDPTPPPVNVTGSAGETFLATFGTPTIGVSVAGNSSGTFTGNDTVLTSGTAQAEGTGNGNFGTKTIPNGMSGSESGASSVVSTVQVQGNLPGSIGAEGAAYQAGQVNVTGSNQYNFSGAANDSSGGFKGANAGSGLLTGFGGGGAIGNSGVFVTETPTLATAGATSGTQSMGNMTGLTGVASASGHTAIGGAGMLGNPTGSGPYAGGWFTGAGNYNVASQGQQAFGAARTIGQGSGSIPTSGNQVSAIGSVTSVACAGCTSVPTITAPTHP